MKQKIIIVGPGTEYIGGISEFISGIFNSELNNNFDLILFDSLKIKQRKKTNAKTVFSIFEIISSLKLLYFFSIKLIRNPKAKIHIHSSSYFGFYEKLILLIIAKAFRKETFFHIHGGEFVTFLKNNKIKPFLIKILNLSDTIICVSEDIFKVINLPHKSIILGNGITIPCDISVKSYDEPSVFLSVSVLEYRKRIDIILEVVDELINDGYSNFRFAFAGDGPEKNNLIKKIESKNINKFVKYYGIVKDKEKEKLFRNSHVFISTSLSESFGISIAEGMSYGLGIIATKEGIAKSCIKDDNGILIEKNDKKSLKNAMISYLNRNESIELQSSNNYNYIKSNYSWGVISKQLKNIYERKGLNEL